MSIQQQDAELARIKKEQEAVDNANNDIINAAIIADIASGAGKKEAQEVAEKAGQTLADATPKIEIPRPQSIIEDGKKPLMSYLGITQTRQKPRLIPLKLQRMVFSTRIIRIILFRSLQHLRNLLLPTYLK